MERTPVRRCMQCSHTLPDPDQSPQDILQQGRRMICVKNPPHATVLVINGQVGHAQTYPKIDAKTISCDGFGFASETLLEGLQ